MWNQISVRQAHGQGLCHGLVDPSECLWSQPMGVPAQQQDRCWPMSGNRGFRWPPRGCNFPRAVLQPLTLPLHSPSFPLLLHRSGPTTIWRSSSPTLTPSPVSCIGISLNKSYPGLLLLSSVLSIRCQLSKPDNQAEWHCSGGKKANRENIQQRGWFSLVT